MGAQNFNFALNCLQNRDQH